MADGNEIGRAEAKKLLDQRLDQIRREKEWRTERDKPFDAWVRGAWVAVLPLHGRGQEILIALSDLLDCFERALVIEGTGRKPMVSDFTSERFRSYAAAFYWGWTRSSARPPIGTSKPS